jgi:cell migration-inducing and hyaluronan-binding protein
MPSPCTFRKIDPRFDSDNRNATAYRTLAIHDLDGSTTGIPDSYVLIHDGENDSVATDDTCKIQPPGTPLCARVISDAFSSASGGPDPQGVLVLR